MKSFENPIIDSEQNLEVKSEPDLNLDIIDEKKSKRMLEAKEALRGIILSDGRGAVVDKVRKDALAYLSGDSSEAENLLLDLDEALKIPDENESIDKALKILAPVIFFKIDHPEEYQQIQRERIVNDERFIKINDLFAYGIGRSAEGDFIHLHVFPAEGRKDMVALMRDGMRKLAEIVENDQSIKKVIATSWIVASNPGLLRRLGFEILGPISEEERDKYFKGETRPISKAVLPLDRLEKYLDSSK